MEKKGLSKSQRMQLKAFICLLGILLLIVLVTGKLLVSFLHRNQEDKESPTPHIPVVTELSNVWIMEQDETGILIFRDGERESYSWGSLQEDSSDPSPDQQNGGVYQPSVSVREQVADVTLTDGSVTAIFLKNEKINGRVLGADESGIEIEGYGRLPLAADYKGYRLYDSLEMCTGRDLLFGYSFTDFCIENGEICGILMVKEEAMKNIRVLLKGNNFSGLFHESVCVTADTEFTVVYGVGENQVTEAYGAGELLEFTYDSSSFEDGRVRIIPGVLTGKLSVTSLSRSQGTPVYRGQMELLRTGEGIVVINEVLLEDYLYSVVPSEMPSGYPAEALKAQAICARTYAYGHMEHAGYPQYGAHVDDSISYQVYNNLLEQESTTTAVKNTFGQLMYTDTGELAGTYYYSTSCGVGSDANVWKTESAKQITYLRAKELNREAMQQEISARAAGESAQKETQELGEALREEEAFAAFISQTDAGDFECNEGWYRWSYQVKKLDAEYISEVLNKRYEVNSRLVLTWADGEYISMEPGEIGNIREIYIEKRGAGGVADELVIEAENGKYKVISEHNIRYVLNDGESKVVRQDGSSVASPNLLPSGFFVVETGKENGNVVEYKLIGGGFGHGVGMSQNGARSMAGEGYRAEDILLYFYENCTIQKIYE